MNITWNIFRPKIYDVGINYSVELGGSRRKRKEDGALLVHCKANSGSHGWLHDKQKFAHFRMILDIAIITKHMSDIDAVATN